MAIPVPAGTDPACDFAEDWCATTAAINAKIAAYQTALARAYPASPMALLRRTERLAAGYVPLAPIPMTEATFDTAGMTDLDADPTVITIQQTGRYIVRGFMLTETSTIVNNLAAVTVNIGTTGATIPGFALDRGNLNMSLSAFHPAAFSDGTGFIKGTKISLSNSSLSTPAILKASLFVGWHVDQVNP